MTAEREARKYAIEAEVDKRRKQSEIRFHSIMNGESQTPTLLYPWLTVSDLMSHRENSSRGTLVVSLHTQSYFLLLLALDDAGLSCTAITTNELAGRLRASRFRATGDLRFESQLLPKSIRECRSGERYFFMMADVLSPAGPNIMIPVFGRGMVYTVSWARMAIRLQLNVLAAVLNDRGETASVALRLLEGPFTDEFELATQTFRAFDDALGRDLSCWENEPPWTTYSAPLPDLSPDNDEELIREIHLRSACSHEVARRFLEIKRGGWPSVKPPPTPFPRS